MRGTFVQVFFRPTTLVRFIFNRFFFVPFPHPTGLVSRHPLTQRKKSERIRTFHAGASYYLAMSLRERINHDQSLKIKSKLINLTLNRWISTPNVWVGRIASRFSFVPPLWYGLFSTGFFSSPPPHPTGLVSHHPLTQRKKSERIRTFHAGASYYLAMSLCERINHDQSLKIKSKLINLTLNRWITLIRKQIIDFKKNRSITLIRKQITDFKKINI